MPIISEPPSPSPQSYSSNYPSPPTPSPPPPSGYSRPPFVNLSPPPTAGNIAVGIGFGLLPFIVEAAVPAIAIVGLPLVAGAFVSFGAFVLACAAGLLPTSICPRPDNPSPGGKTPGFKGGQCCDIDYKVRVRFVFNDGRLNQVTLLSGTYQGTILGIQYREFLQANNTTRVGSILRWRKCSGTILEQDIAQDNKPQSFSCEVIEVFPAYGVPDRCGDPPPQPQPQKMPEQISNLGNGGSGTNRGSFAPNPAPPSPLPRKAPPPSKVPSPQPQGKLTRGGGVPGGSTSPGGGGGGVPGGSANSGGGGSYFNPGSSFNSGGGVNPGGGGNYNDFPDTFSDFPPSPQPNSRYPGGAVAASLPPPPPPPVVLSLPPEIPPPLPDRLPPDSTEQDKYIYRQNKEILDKVYRANGEILEIQQEQEKQGRILKNIQSLLDFEVQGSQLITRCDDIDIFYSYKGKILEAINQQLNQVKTIEQTIISEICQVEASAAVAAPDWWAVRLGGDTPQLALIFRVAKTRTYHTLVVPHPINTAPLTIAPIPSYKKGNWMGMITCKDNSKFVCNCGTKGEATRLLFIAASLINPVFLGDPVRFYYAERKGGAVAEGDMRGTSAQYFPVGQRQTKPLWRVTFTRDGQ